MLQHGEVRGDSEWVWEKRPARLRFQKECGARLIDFFRYKPFFRKFEEGMAFGILHVYWGPEIVGYWKKVDTSS